jgi:acyl-coenzyme A synthetase/AMP-(fatty) acid ligase
VNNASDTTANIAKQAIKRIAEVTGRAVVANTAPIKGRVFKIIVALQKGSDTQTNIVKYLPSELEEVKAPL